MCSVRPLQKMAKKQKKEKAWKNEMSHRFDAQKNSYCTPKRLCISSVKQRLSPSSKHFPRSHWILFSARGRHLIRPAIVVPAAPYELGQLKSGQRFLKSNLVNHWKLGLENWKHRQWHNSSAYAGPNSLRIRLDLAEISNKTQNYLFLATFFAKNLNDSSTIVVPDQGENWVGVGCPEDTWRRSISAALPNSSPIKRYDKKTVPMH